MFINIKKGVTLRESDVIGIFDMDNATMSDTTNKFLKKNENDGKLVTVDDLPKTFVLVKNTVYFSTKTASHLKKINNFML